MNEGAMLFIVFFPFLAAMISHLINRRTETGRDYFVMTVSVMVFVAAVFLFAQQGLTAVPYYVIPQICGEGLTFKIDGFRSLYALLSAFTWLMTSLLSREYFQGANNQGRYHFFNLWTLGATLGIFFSADFFTTYFFFEIMTFTSFVMVINNEDVAAQEAGRLYLGGAIIGGLVMLMGINLLNEITGTIQFDQLVTVAPQFVNQPAFWVAGGAIFFGFAVKAGIFPMHFWLPVVYPAAPAPASAILSGILSKTGIFGALIVSLYLFPQQDAWGMLVLVLGCITMFLGALLAVFAVDLKRVLACSSFSQIGFIVLGVALSNLMGDHNALAVRGTLLHMVNHSLIKLVLFLIAGVVFMNLGSLNLNDIKGFGRGKPFLRVVFLFAALSVAGIPLLSGYVSKTLLHESLLEHIYHLKELGLPYQSFKWIEKLFKLTGGMTFAYMTKLYVVLFHEGTQEAGKASAGQDHSYIQRKGMVAIGITALLLPGMGIFTGLMDRMAETGIDFFHGGPLVHAVDYFHWVNLKGGLITVAIGLAVYFLFIRLLLTQKEGDGERSYPSCWPSKLDLNRGLFQPLVLGFLPAVGTWIARGFYLTGDVLFNIPFMAVPMAARAAEGMYHLGEIGMQGDIDHAPIGTVVEDVFMLDEATVKEKTGPLEWGWKMAGFFFNIGEFLLTGIQYLLYWVLRIATKAYYLVEDGAYGFIKLFAILIERLGGPGIQHPERHRPPIPDFARRNGRKQVSDEDKQEQRQTWQVISNSISYSLLLFGIGLLATMLFLLYLR